MWKTSIRGYLMSRPQIKKLFWSIVFSYPNQQQWTISWSDCDMRQKVEFIQLEMTSSVFRPRRSSKALRKDPNLHQKKKVMVTLLRSADGLIHYSFLNPSETITSEKYAQQIDEMHWKLQHPQLVLINRTGLILLHDTAQPHATQPMGCEVLLHPPRSPDFLPTNYHIFKHLDNFSQGKCFHNQQEVENAFQEFTESQSMDFHATGINKLISCWQKCVNCNGSYFD